MCKVSRSSNGVTKEMNKTGDREVEIEGSPKSKRKAAGVEGANEGRGGEGRGEKSCSTKQS